MPVLALWTGNASEVRGSTPLVIIGVLTTGTVLLAASITVVQRDIRRSALVASFVMVVFGSYGKFAGDGLHVHLGLGLVVSAVVLWAVGAVRLHEQRVKTLTTVLNVIGLALVASNATAIMMNRPYNVAVAAASLPDGDQVRSDHPDVWYIAPDRYPDLDLLESMGVNTHQFKDELERRGFDVAERAWANYPATQVSLASAWNAAPLEVPAGINPTSYAVELLKDPRIGRMFRAAGYDYLHLGTWLDDTRSSTSASEVLTLRGRGEFYAAFDQSSLLPTLRAAFGLATPGLGNIRTRQLAHARHQLPMLRNLAAAAPSPRPQFVLTHITLPHPPYVFDEDGSERRPSVPGDDRRAAFEAQLAYFNDQLLEIIDIAQGRAEPPIIVLLADEGVYPEDVAPLDRPDYDPRDLSPSELRQKMSITAAVFDPEGEVALEGTRVTPLSVLDQVLRRVLDIGVDDADAPIFYWAPSGSEEPFVDVTRELVEGSDG